MGKTDEEVEALSHGFLPAAARAARPAVTRRGQQGGLQRAASRRAAAPQRVVSKAGRESAAVQLRGP